MRFNVCGHLRCHVHLLGVDHKFQFMPTLPWEKGGPLIDSTHPALFERFLLKLTVRICPDLVAEEASQPDPQAHMVSVARGVADHFGIPHKFCDPNPTERLALYERTGISEEQDRRDGFPIREAFWLSKLSENTEAHTILFVCGAYHIDSFSLKLRNALCKVSVVKRDWAPTAG